MREKIKVGIKISCLIEEALPNYLLVSFKTSKTVFRGVLISETYPIVRRVVPDDFYPRKSVLDFQTAENLKQLITTQCTPSKALRSSKFRQNCIILDDYDCSSATVLGKSPIESIRGLVESIDAAEDLDYSKPPGEILCHPLGCTASASAVSFTCDREVRQASDDVVKSSSSSPSMEVGSSGSPAGKPEKTPHAVTSSQMSGKSLVYISDAGKSAGCIKDTSPEVSVSEVRPLVDCGTASDSENIATSPPSGVKSCESVWLGDVSSSNDASKGSSTDAVASRLPSEKQAKQSGERLKHRATKRPSDGPPIKLRIAIKDLSESSSRARSPDQEEPLPPRRRSHTHLSVRNTRRRERLRKARVVLLGKRLKRKSHGELRAENARFERFGQNSSTSSSLEKPRRRLDPIINALTNIRNYKSARKRGVFSVPAELPLKRKRVLSYKIRLNEAAKEDQLRSKPRPNTPTKPAALSDTSLASLTSSRFHAVAKPHSQTSRAAASVPPEAQACAPIILSRRETAKNVLAKKQASDFQPPCRVSARLKGSKPELGTLDLSTRCKRGMTREADKVFAPGKARRELGRRSSGSKCGARSPERRASRAARGLSRVRRVSEPSMEASESKDEVQSSFVSPSVEVSSLTELKGTRSESPEQGKYNKEKVLSTQAQVPNCQASVSLEASILKVDLSSVGCSNTSVIKVEASEDLFKVNVSKLASFPSTETTAPVVLLQRSELKGLEALPPCAHECLRAASSVLTKADLLAAESLMSLTPRGVASELRFPARGSTSASAVACADNGRITATPVPVFQDYAPEELELVCLEPRFSPDEEAKAGSRASLKANTRRSPADRRVTGSDGAPSQESSVHPQAKQGDRLQTGCRHNTRFRGTRSVIPSLNLTNRRRSRKVAASADRDFKHHLGKSQAGPGTSVIGSEASDTSACRTSTLLAPHTEGGTSTGSTAKNSDGQCADKLFSPARTACSSDFYRSIVDDALDEASSLATSDKRSEISDILPQCPDRWNCAGATQENGAIFFDCSFSPRPELLLPIDVATEPDPPSVRPDSSMSVQSPLKSMIKLKPKSGKQSKKHRQIFEDHSSLEKVMKTGDKEIEVGDIIWGKVLGHPWWPGKVLSMEGDSSTSKGQRSAHVAWFGSNTQSVMSTDLLELFLARFAKRHAPKKYGPYVNAVKEAMFACKLKYS